MDLMETDSGGPVMPFLFILITIAVLPTAISFALLNNRRPSAGAGYTWLWESTYPGIGLWLGWIMITTYVVVSALYPVAFGTFFNALLSYFNRTATTWTGIGGGVAAILIIGYLNHNNIKLSSTVIGVLMIAEATFVAAVALVIVVRGGHLGHFSASPFNPGPRPPGSLG
jgi:amino acid transporter